MTRFTRAEEVRLFAEKRRAQDASYARVAIVCGGPGCQAAGCQAIAACLSQELAKDGIGCKVKVRTTGCHGFCEQGPLMVIEPESILYCRIKPEDVSEIVSETLGKGKIIERLLYTDPGTGNRIAKEGDVPFYKAQDRSILGRNKLVDPSDIGDYICQGGYQSFMKALTSMSPEEVISKIAASGLRGRGGAGFPTGRKWESCRKASGTPKYVICNADEGDPGAFMDRGILEGNPHSVIEGMLIGAYAIGAESGFIYVRNEYPVAVLNSGIAIRQAEEAGLLGRNILGTDFCFDLKVVRGGGAFVCGESTALMASLEGKVGEPRPKDIHTTERGYRDLPSNLNNVETWANVPPIITHGESWLASKGTANSKGTKIFALTGKVRNTGLVEIPMGATIRKIVYDIGGGSPTASKIKAVQIGGPSGGCLPERLFDLPVDYEALTESGAMVGSGGLVVMDEGTCMVNVAHYFLKFLIDESCGKCVPCRIGVRRMCEIVGEIAEGRGTEQMLSLLEDTAEVVAAGSLCALGKTAPNPLLTTLRYFRDEYETHIRDKKCPAGVCRALITYSILSKKCDGCGACLKACPHGAIAKKDKKTYVLDEEKCRKCGICRDVCTRQAILVA
jgi:NADH:ubiquinone oxidoreductase subunit F (NADH-binding)/(2Fe-2S) ferredoxin/NAD-dependent dihydropyrimidine dehydrogenase PreA subunit